MRRSPSLLLAARILLIAVAAGLALAALRTVWQKSPVLDQAYACPMHPQIRAGAPGDCPICGMALVRKGEVTLASVLPEQDPGATAIARRRVFSQPLRAPAWVEDGRIVAVLYDDDLASIGPDESCRFHSDSSGGAIIVVRRTADGPSRWDEATSRASFAPAAGKAPPAPGSTGWVELEQKPRARLVVPATAVIQGDPGPQVLAVAAGGRYEARAVRLGRVVGGLASVVSGLSEGEEVVARGAWFLEADRRLTPAAAAR